MKKNVIIYLVTQEGGGILKKVTNSDIGGERSKI